MGLGQIGLGELGLGKMGLGGMGQNRIALCGAGEAEARGDRE